MVQQHPEVGSSRSTKDGRIALRVSTVERQLIELASVEVATTVSDFVLRATLARAAEVLAARTEFRLPPERWDAFVAMLDEPPTAQARPRLQRLLTEPSVLER